MSTPIPKIPSESDAVSREQLEEFIQVITHDLRNRLNGIALEAADLAEQAGDAADANRIQERVRSCALFLKTVRDLVTPDDPSSEKWTLAEIIARLRARDLDAPK